MDSQLLHAYGGCQRKYWLTAAEHLVALEPYRTRSGTPLAKNTGSLVHDIMHRVNRAKVWRHKLSDTNLLKIGFKRLAKEKELTPEERLFLSQKWVQFYAWDKIQGAHYKPLGTEVGFSKVLYSDEDTIFVYEGRIDLIVLAETLKAPSWVDYKTQGRDSSIYKNRNQFLGYSWALDTNIGFILVFGLQKEKEKPFAYKTVYHSDSLKAQWKEETIATFREVLTKSLYGKFQFKLCRSHCDEGMYGWCKFLKICDNLNAPQDVQNGIRRIFYKEKEWKPWEKMKWKQSEALEISGSQSWEDSKLIEP